MKIVRDDIHMASDYLWGHNESVFDFSICIY